MQHIFPKGKCSLLACCLRFLSRQVRWYIHDICRCNADFCLTVMTYLKKIDLIFLNLIKFYNLLFTFTNLILMLAIVTEVRYHSTCTVRLNLLILLSLQVDHSISWLVVHVLYFALASVWLNRPTSLKRH